MFLGDPRGLGVFLWARYTCTYLAALQRRDTPRCSASLRLHLAAKRLDCVLVVGAVSLQLELLFWGNGFLCQHLS